MDDPIEQSIIQKVVRKQLAIYKVLDMLPNTKDLWEEKNSIDHNPNLTRKEETVNESSIIETKTDSTKNVLNDTTNRKSGIYKIVNKVDGKYYVGRAVNFRKRWTIHKRNLIKNIHPNFYLQNAWNKYGSENFEFVVVEYVENNLEVLIETEDKYIKKFLEDRRTGIDNCYNISESADGGCGPHSEKHKKNISESLKGIKRTEDHQRKLNESHRGKKLSETTKKKLSELNKGINNPKADKNIYNWRNVSTGETFTGTRTNFKETFNLSGGSIYRLMNRSTSITKSGWILEKST